MGGTTKAHACRTCRGTMDLAPLELSPGSPVIDAFRAAGVQVPRAQVLGYSLPLRATLLASGRFLTIVPGSVLRYSAERLSLTALPLDLPSWHEPVAVLTLRNRVSIRSQSFSSTARVRRRNRWLTCTVTVRFGLRATASRRLPQLRHSKNSPEPATIAPPMIRLTVGTSSQIRKPSIIAQISEKYWNGETTDVGARWMARSTNIARARCRRH